LRDEERPAQPGTRGLGLIGRLVLGAGGAFLALVVGLAALSLQHFQQANDEVIGSQQVVLAATVAEELEGGLQRARTALEAAAVSAPAEVLTDPRAARAWLDQRIVLPRLFTDGVWLVDGAGRVLAASAAAVAVPLPEERGWTAPLATYSGAHAAGRSGQPSIHVTVPVAGVGGAPSGRLVGGLELPGEGFLPRLGQLRIGRGGYFSLLTPDGRLLLHPDRPRLLGPVSPRGVNVAVDRALEGHQGWLRTRTSAGVEMVTAVQRVPSTGWIVLANLPADEADAPFLAARRWFLLATLAGTLALFAAAWAAARGLTRPLGLLTRGVEALAEGGEAWPLAPRVGGGGEVGTLAAAFDRLVAQRRRAEAGLRASEERHLSVVRNLPVVQWAIGPDHRFTLSVGGALPALGLAEGQVVGLLVQDVYAGQEEVLDHYRRARAGEAFVTTNDFGHAVFESHWAPVRGPDGEVVGVSGLALDVTARRRAEVAQREAGARLATLERMAAMGRVAAGVAHEINNPLTYVIGALDSAAERLREGRPDDLPGLLAEARGGAERVRRIVGDLRVFARARDEASGSCDAAAVARQAAAMVQNEIRHRARLELDVREAPAVGMPEHRLVQVLVNLLVNACHAIPEGRAGENRIGVAVRPEGGRVVVEVSDSGAGMTEEVRTRIFEPFFTTRQVGEGMGLGLALCQAMVTEAGGEIEVVTAPGKGSTFRLRLQPAPAPHDPAAEAPPGAPAATTPPAPSAAAPAPAAQAPLRVLVVDDEPMVGRAVARLLGGHQVDLATSGAQALELIRGGAAYQVVICDLMMPEMTGMDLRERLAAEAPDVAGRMVFLTGGAFTERARAFVDHGGVRVLEKPVDVAALRAVVAEIGGAG